MDLDFFSNFHTMLPGGRRTKIDAEIIGRRVFTEFGVSERIKGQTGYEFFEECRTACLEAGFTEQQVIELRKKFNDNIHNKNILDEGLEAEYIDMLTKVYTILRLRGYKHYPDLIG